VSQATHTQLDAARHAADGRAVAAPAAAGARVVAVGSGKGGVGTSTVAALLAATLAADGRRVLLVDAVARMGHLHVMLGVEPRATLGMLRKGLEPEALLVPVAPTLSLLPALADGDAPLSDAERRVLTARTTALYPAFDLVVVDAGASAASLLDACAQGASRMLAIGAAERVGLAATFALIKLVHQRFPHVRVDLLANRTDESTARLAHDYLNAATVRFLSRTVYAAGVIPEDRDFGNALAAGLGPHDAAAGSAAAEAIRPIGERLLAELASPSDATPPRVFRMRES
jgi:MinD-like ATPase involved in chromosome partitioning or flagellar assembly